MMETPDGGLTVMASGLATWKPNKQQNHKGWGGGCRSLFLFACAYFKKKKGSHTLLKGKRNHEKKKKENLKM